MCGQEVRVTYVGLALHGSDVQILDSVLELHGYEE